MLYQVHSNNLSKVLDMPLTDDYYYKDINKSQPKGCSNGLAYINDGYGSVLKVQFVAKGFDTKNKGELSFTGRLGETMKESVEIVKIAVFNYALQELQMAPEALESCSYHLHVPQGAIPKDGPSAGTSIFAALMSLLINKPVKQNLALTGEISTLGEVITIGGVREKLTACKNHGISQVVLPYSNR